MIDQLIHIDQDIFRLIHSTWANDVFDSILPWMREARTWIPLYGLFLYLAVKKYQWKGLYFILATVLVVILCDRFSAGFMKPYFERLRPCHEPALADILRPIIDCGGQYGFISSHATNHFGLAVMFTWFFKQISSLGISNWVFYAWAALISFAQIYVGKHYLGDVVVGMIYGLLIGIIVLRLFSRFIKLPNV